MNNNRVLRLLKAGLETTLQVAQSGEMGIPTREDLEICGKLHVILEEITGKVRPGK